VIQTTKHQKRNQLLLSHNVAIHTWHPSKIFHQNSSTSFSSYPAKRQTDTHKGNKTIPVVNFQYPARHSTAVVLRFYYYYSQRWPGH